MAVRVLRALLLPIALTACHPFAMFETDEETLVPPDKVAAVRLLVDSRPLPPSAANVRMHLRQFQDPQLWVMFDADLEEARAFARKLIGGPLHPVRKVGLGADDEIAWWPKSMPAGAEGGEDMIADDAMPAVKVMLLPRGTRATVWVFTFSD